MNDYKFIVSLFIVLSICMVGLIFQVIGMIGFYNIIFA